MFKILVCGVLLLSAPAARAERNPDFNRYILRAIEKLEAGDWNSKGYASSFITHPLSYGPHTIPKGRLAPKTMCVGAVEEVIIVALDLFIKETEDAELAKRIVKDLPARTWTGARRDDIRPYIFMFDTVTSYGTAHALEQFGIGVQVPFAELVPGDFIGLNRETGTGHAVVFLGYLDAKGNGVAKYDAQTVVGFKYYSAQSSKPSGLGHRWAFFSGHCPKQPLENKPLDCRIHSQRSQRTLNTGYMLDPTRWTVSAAKQQRDALLRTRLAEEEGIVMPPDPRNLKDRLRARIDREFARQSMETLRDTFDLEKFDGETPTSD